MSAGAGGGGGGGGTPSGVGATSGTSAASVAQASGSAWSYNPWTTAYTGATGAVGATNPMAASYAAMAANPYAYYYGYGMNPAAMNVGVATTICLCSATSHSRSSFSQTAASTTSTAAPTSTTMTASNNAASGTPPNPAAAYAYYAALAAQQQYAYPYAMNPMMGRGTTTTTPSAVSYAAALQQNKTGAYGHAATGYGRGAGATPAAQPKQAPTATPKQSSMAPSSWPPKLREYVERAFERCKGDAMKTKTEAALKQIISEAIEKNALWTRDWSSFPLPDVPAPAPAPAPAANDSVKRPKLEGGVAKMPTAPAFNSNTSTWKTEDDSGSHSFFYQRPKTNQLAQLKDELEFEKQQQAQNQKQNNNKAKEKKPSRFDQRPTESDEDQETLRKRSERFAPKGKKAAAAMKRFNVASYASSSSASSGGSFGGGGGGEDDEISYEPIKGTSTSLEKQYLRLTSAPDPSTVRPEHILKETIAMLKRKWKDKPDYAYTCEQLKSVRQDLTVQAIKNSFTVEVYELHARLALENGDLGEYSQCQTQIYDLHMHLKLPGCHLEFAAYRFLHGVYTRSATSIIKWLGELTTEQRLHPAVFHALSVRTAIESNNFHAFFKLYASPPNMSGYLLDLLVPRMRDAALRVLTKAYKPAGFPVQWIATELAFEETDDCVEWLKENNVSLSADQTEVVLKN